MIAIEITPTGCWARAIKIVRCSPSSSPRQLRSLHCSAAGKPARSNTMIAGRSSRRAGEDADLRIARGHESSPHALVVQHRFGPCHLPRIGMAQIQRLVTGLGKCRTASRKYAGIERSGARYRVAVDRRKGRLQVRWWADRGTSLGRDTRGSPSRTPAEV